MHHFSRAALSAACEAKWYALRVRSNHEFLVTAQLEERSLDAFLPWYPRLEHFSGRNLRLRRPLFPGYVFACFDPSRDRAGVISVRGVVSVVSRGQIPEPVSEAVIEQLRLIASARPGDVSPAVYSPGEKVTVARGPLAGLTGVIERTKGERVKGGGRRLVVTIAMLNRACAVEIGEAEVYRARA